MDYIQILGYTAGIMGTLSFAPQVYRTWKLKKTNEISLGMFSLISAAIFLWVVYGFLVGDKPVYISNFFAFILSFSILIMKLRYG